MKFDYKPKMNSIGSLLLQRTIHVSLGFITFIFLILFFSFRSQRSDLETQEISSTDTVQVSMDNASSPAQINKKSLTAENSISNWHTIRIRERDTLSKIFARLGLSTRDLHEIMTTDPATKHLASLQPGQIIKLKTNKDQQIAGIILNIAPGNTLHVWRKEEGFQVEHKLIPLQKRLAFGKGAIQDSLFLSGKRAGLDPKILSQMVDIFGWSIDFALDLQPNDTFRVLYEEKYLDGERIQTGNVIAAEIINGGKKHQAVHYHDNQGISGYFTPEGYGMNQAFLRAPVNFTRISSHFGKRRHPVLHHLRHHKGVDYSAPRGTPVQATGDGRVIFIGTRGGYGKVVEIQHGSRYSTLYAHLSRFPQGLHYGAPVKQGQIIGFVGRTGLATGDHLHYEFRMDGVHRNPLTVVLPKKNPIPEKYRPHFMAHAKEMLKLLDTHEHKINVAQRNINNNSDF